MVQAKKPSRWEGFFAQESESDSFKRAIMDDGGSKEDAAAKEQGAIGARHQHYPDGGGVQHRTGSRRGRAGTRVEEHGRDGRPDDNAEGHGHHEHGEE